MPPEFLCYFRGRLCRVDGWIEPHDYSVGIMGDSFCYENVTPLDNGDPIEFETITESEALCLDRAFWQSYDGEFNHVRCWSYDLAGLEGSPFEDSAFGSVL